MLPRVHKPEGHPLERLPGNPKPSPIQAGNRARARREQLGLSRAQLAEITNVPLKYLKRWETKGIPAGEDAATIGRLEGGLKVSVGWLFAVGVDIASVPDTGRQTTHQAAGTHRDERGEPLAKHFPSPPARTVGHTAVQKLPDGADANKQLSSAMAAANRARARREQLGIHRTALARTMGVSLSSLARWEATGITDYSDAGTIRRWEEALSVAPGWIKGAKPRKADKDTVSDKSVDQNAAAGIRARGRRESLGLSRAVVALRIGVTQKTLAMWECQGLPTRLPLPIAKRWEQSLSLEEGSLIVYGPKDVSRREIECREPQTAREVIESVANALASTPSPESPGARRKSGPREHTARKATLFMQRYGVDAEFGTTFKAIGDRNGITESRVCQIMGVLLGRTKSIEITAPIFKQILDAARPHLPCVQEHLQDILLPLLGPGLSLEGATRFASDLMQQPLFEFIHRTTPTGTEVIVYDPAGGDARSFLDERERSMMRMAQAMIRASGAGHMGLIMSFAATQRWETSAVESIRAALSAEPGFEWLEGGDEPQWFWFKEDNPGRNPVIEALRRVFAVARDPVGIESLLGAIECMREKRAVRQALSPMLGVSPPVAVLRTLLARIEWLHAATRDDFTSLISLDPAQELPVAEYELYQELHRGGGVASRSTLMATLMKDSVGPASALSALLLRSPIVTRFCYGVYMLRGYTPAPVDLARAIESAPSLRNSL